MIITNGVDSVSKNNTEVENLIYSSSLQDDQSFLVVTGRRELNGFKGYRHYRRGYRKYDDSWWYPETAFVSAEHLKERHGLLKKISSPDKRLLIFSLEEKKPWMFKQHIDSCVARYRSYNRKDNSYQPFNGPRKQCFSRFFKELKMLKLKEP
ncbi:BA14K family protein [Bartonella sp. B41]